MTNMKFDTCERTFKDYANLGNYQVAICARSFTCKKDVEPVSQGGATDPMVRTIVPILNSNSKGSFCGLHLSIYFILFYFILFFLKMCLHHLL